MEPRSWSEEACSHCKGYPEYLECTCSDYVKERRAERALLSMVRLGKTAVPTEGLLFPNLRIFIDGAGQQLFNVHTPDMCEGRACVLHNRSEHSTRHMKLVARIPGLGSIKPLHMERICKHGVGHPDPDDMEYWKSVGEESMGVHGCDGCCA